MGKGSHRLVSSDRFMNLRLHVIYLLDLDAGHHLFKTDEFIYREATTNRYHDVRDPDFQ